MPITSSSAAAAGLLLVNQPLTEKNYSQWCRAMTIALTAKFKIGMIDGTHVRPESGSPFCNTEKGVTIW